MKLNQTLCALLILLFSSSASAQSPSDFVVDDIKIEGLQRVALGAALTYMPVKVGDTMNGFRIAQVIKSLYSSTHFENIQVLRDGNTLVVRVKERPTISNIIFEGNDDIKDPADVPFATLVPAFITSELKSAFSIGFLIYIPFVVIDLVVASVLMSMGMMMLSPMMISMPFKLMLFVLVDGWTLIMGSLASSFAVL